MKKLSLLMVLILILTVFSSCKTNSDNEEASPIPPVLLPNLSGPSGPSYDVRDEESHFETSIAAIPSYVDLNAIPDGYTLKDAANDGCVAFNDLHLVSGSDVWNAFLYSVKAGKPCTIRIAEYYSDDKLYLSDLSFGGASYSVETTEGTSESFLYLNHYTDSVPNNPKYSKVDRYILTNDKYLTYKQLEFSMLSSSSLNQIPQYTVYCNFIKVGDKTPTNFNVLTNGRYYAYDTFNATKTGWIWFEDNGTMYYQADKDSSIEEYNYTKTDNTIVATFGRNTIKINLLTDYSLEMEQTFFYYRENNDNISFNEAVFYADYMNNETFSSIGLPMNSSKAFISPHMAMSICYFGPYVILDNHLYIYPESGGFLLFEIKKGSIVLTDFENDSLSSRLKKGLVYTEHLLDSSVTQVPLPFENISDFSEKELLDMLKGFSQDSLHGTWGRPSGILSGFYGDIWILDSDKHLTVYYDPETKLVENVKFWENSK